MCHFNKQKIVHDCRLFHKINQSDGNYNDAVQLWCFLAFNIMRHKCCQYKDYNDASREIVSYILRFLAHAWTASIYKSISNAYWFTSIASREKKGKKKLCQTRLHLIFCAIGLSLLWLQWIYITCRYYAICKNVPQTSLFRDRLRNIIFMKLHPTAEKV